MEKGDGGESCPMARGWQERSDQVVKVGGLPREVGVGLGDGGKESGRGWRLLSKGGDPRRGDCRWGGFMLGG